MVLTRSLRLHFGLGLVILTGLAFLTGCVKEMEKRDVTLAGPAPLKPIAGAKHGGEASFGPVVSAVMLDVDAQLPSPYAQDGLKALVVALQSKGLDAFAASGWDDVYEVKAGVKTLRAELAIIVSFQDVLKLNTLDAAQQKCGCKFTGKIIEVASGRVLHGEDVEYEGEPGKGFDKACLSAVISSAKAYAEVARHLIENYRAPQANVVGD
ncbi:MAG TPA: hypothetical protein VM163_00645 [bacterium]|nr:hypothetical protein [bacterium]